MSYGDEVYEMYRDALNGAELLIEQEMLKEASAVLNFTSKTLNKDIDRLSDYQAENVTYIWEELDRKLTNLEFANKR